MEEEEGAKKSWEQKVVEKSKESPLKYFQLQNNNINNKNNDNNNNNMIKIIVLIKRDKIGDLFKNEYHVNL